MASKTAATRAPSNRSAASSADSIKRGISYAYEEPERTWGQFLRGMIPRIELVNVLRQYDAAPLSWTDRLAGDVSAGIVVAVMLIPQGMAYSTLAGLEPMYGLYASIIGLLIYPLFSTSPQLAVGPVAMMSLLTAASIGMFEDVEERTDRYHNLAFKLAFLTGVFSFLLGLFRAGYLVNFLSHPVLKGFTAAAAIIIGSSQLSKVLGFKIARHPEVYMTWADAVTGIAEGETNWVTFALFVENMLLFYMLRWLRIFLRSHPSVKSSKVLMQIVNAFPNALVVVIVNILIVGEARLDLSHNVSIVGDVEAGLPAPVNIFDSTFGEDAIKLLPTAVVMALVGFMESISVAKAMALRFDTVVDSNQELVGLGLANTIGSFFNAFPITGGFSRTSVNADAGAKTSLAGMISSVILILVVLFMTTLFKFLPSVTLGSIIIFAVLKLIELETPRMLWAVDKEDFFVYLSAFIFTLLLGIEEGILVGAGISIARLIKQSAAPHIAHMGRVPGTTTWRNMKRFPGKVFPESGIRVVRYDAQLYFANASSFRDVIAKLALPSTEGEHVPRAIIVDASGITSVDSSAIHMLENIPNELTKAAKTHHAHRIAELESRLKKMGGDSARTALAGAAAGAACAPAEGSHDALDVEAAEEANPWLNTIPDWDDDVDTADAICERISRLRGSSPRVPALFFACVHGPVRDMFLRNDHFVEAEKAHRAAIKPSFWNCTHPCTCTNPMAGCCSSTHAPHKDAKEEDTLPSFMTAGSSEEEVDGDAIYGPAGPLNKGLSEILNFVLQHQDVDAAVEHVKRLWARERGVETEDEAGAEPAAAAAAVGAGAEAKEDAEEAAASAGAAEGDVELTVAGGAAAATAEEEA